MFDATKQDVFDASLDIYKLPLICRKPKYKRQGSFRQKEARIMSKRGRMNIFLNKIPDKHIKYINDLWNTLVNMRWRWIVIIVFLVNLTAYLIFGNLFLFDAWYSGDFDSIEGHKTCIVGVHNYTSFVMLGIETITTAGYGYFHPTEHCKLVFVIMTFSTLATFFIDGAFISVVYVKISKPHIIDDIFSKKAVINLRNGKLCLILRINDRTGKHWINPKVQLFLVRHELNYVEELDIEPYGTLFWPTDIVHIINEKSPLWTYSAKDIIFKKFEIFTTISGSSNKTAHVSKSQTSYVSKEILWGYRFQNCLEFNTERGEYMVCKKKFNEMLRYDAPLCSAQTLTYFQNL